MKTLVALRSLSIFTLIYLFLGSYMFLGTGNLEFII